MAAKSVIEVALANIDAQIADLNRAKDIIRQSATEPAAEPKKRGRKPRSKPGLPLPAED